MGLSRFIPPVLYGLLPDREKALPRFCSFDAASRFGSYDDEKITAMVAEKTSIYRDAIDRAQPPVIRSGRMAQSLFVLSRESAKGPLHVVELGGACGASYFELRPFLQREIAAWHIVETPAMARVARPRFESGPLRFFPTLKAAVQDLAGPAVLFAQGVLQYLPDPCVVLAEAAVLGVTQVYVTRTQVGDATVANESYLTLVESPLSAHGPGPLPSGHREGTARCPIWFLPRASYLDAAATSYQVECVMEEGDPATVNVGGDRVQTEMWGFLARRRS
jgi:putative methyltransferase (TIGR04325 family)